MTLLDTGLLPALQKLPGAAHDRTHTLRETLTELARNDRTSQSAEFAAATAFGLWSVFDQVNVDDALNTAYAAQYPGLAADHSLHEHWQQMLDSGDQSAAGFISGLKGKIAEFNAADLLEQNGYANVAIAADPTQPVWYISAVNDLGETVFFQVKTGGAGYAASVTEAMGENPDVAFLFSSEIYEQIGAAAPETLAASAAADIGSDYALVAGVQDGLDTLSGNLGIDVPDGLGDILPYAGAIIAGAKLIYSVIQTERQFQAVERTERNKIQVVQTLTLMSRVGVTAALSAAGGMAGGMAGSAVPLIGNLVGGITGSLAGAGIGMYLNRHLQPHIMDLALDITELTRDDLFYYKNKARIDAVALEFRAAAAAVRELPTLPDALVAGAPPLRASSSQTVKTAGIPKRRPGLIGQLADLPEIICGKDPGR